MIYRNTASSILSMKVFENGGKDLSSFSDTSSEVEVTRFLRLSDTFSQSVVRNNEMFNCVYSTRKCISLHVKRDHSRKKKTSQDELN